MENAFAAPGRWYRANLHAHTTNSDGDLTPEGCVDFYHRAGYQILSFTDHWHVTEAEGRDDLLVIPGVELDVGCGRQGMAYHIVGLPLSWRGTLAREAVQTAQEAIDWVRENDGAAYLAHPYWSGLVAADLTSLEGCFALEVYNSGADVESARGYSSVHWDDALTLGMTLGGLATDDGHQHALDHGLGWTMIKAEELTLPAVTEALLRGRYYASTGPSLEDLRVAGDRVYVRSSPAAVIALVSQPTWGERVAAKDGEVLTEAEFALPACRYCRVEVMDRKGKVAWSSPIFRPEYDDSLGRTSWG